MVKNYMEFLVEEYLEELLRTDARFAGVCRCEQCMDDVRAMALNRIEPFYFTCKKGEVFGKFHMQVQQNKATIWQEVVRAVEFVSANKHHE